MIRTAELYRLFQKHPKVITDTRKELNDALFFALRGEKFNGNTFAEAALAKGAAYSIVDDPQYATNERILLVDNTIRTLQQLANLHRQESSAVIFGITGSNGKTTTKELIASVLETSRRITFTRGNLNNHIGVPLSLLDIQPETEIAVIEMGANHVGEIAQLSAIAEPDLGMITNIGKAHLEGFGGYKGVIRAKSELYEFLRKHKRKVLVNAGDPLLMKQSEGMDRWLYNGGDLLGQITASKPTITIQWKYKDQTFSVRTNLYGEYNYFNVMAAVATGLVFGISPENINRGIESYVARNLRSEKVKTNTNTIYLDAYNANPVSMREAIRSFKSNCGPNAWLILGDMFELGDVSREEHLVILKELQDKQFQNVVLVGKEFFRLSDKANYKFFETLPEAGDFLRSHPITNADILIKGSRGMQLESLLKQL